MDYYEFQYMVDNLIEILKEKKSAEEGQQEEYRNNMSQQHQSNKMISDAKKSVPKFNSQKSIKNFPGIPSALKM